MEREIVPSPRSERFRSSSAPRWFTLCLVVLALLPLAATAAHGQASRSRFDKLTLRLYTSAGYLEGYLVFLKDDEEVSYQGPATLELVCGEKRFFRKKWRINVSNFRKIRLSSGRMVYGVTLPSVNLSKLGPLPCRSAFAKLSVKDKSSMAMVRLHD